MRWSKPARLSIFKTFIHKSTFEFCHRVWKASENCILLTCPSRVRLRRLLRRSHLGSSSQWSLLALLHGEGPAFLNAMSLIQSEQTLKSVACIRSPVRSRELKGELDWSTNVFLISSFFYVNMKKKNQHFFLPILLLLRGGSSKRHFISLSYRMHAKWY